ncbi:EamA family transporter [Microterricola pindariensis]|uniref:EamA family transporter n=1 Tax=Microterricola pindariensis TaxID=478010 RepID=A0ABX5ATJ8_9MICO|nr:EamA family transporter [Microterricola pindariensis]PPL15643.1 EamA family transporter [Microterricola pindariensis]
MSTQRTEHEAHIARRGTIGAITQVGTEVSINLGSALAGIAMPLVGAPVVVAVRQIVMTIVLLPVYRPKRAELSWARLWPAVALGVVLAVMNLSFYASVHIIGLGLAATIEFLGPLALALAVSRRLLDFVCALAAGVGVVLLTGLDGTVDLLGIALALIAGAAWAGYILLTRRVALTLPGLEGLTVAGIVSLVLVIPVAVFTFDASTLNLGIVGLLVAIGVLSSALPYSLDTFILRRVDTRVYAIITACGPAIAALFGWLILAEQFSGLQIVAIGLVCAAAATAIATQRQRPATDLELSAEAQL